MDYVRPQTIQDYYLLAKRIDSYPLHKTYEIVRHLLRIDLFFLCGLDVNELIWSTLGY